MPEELNIVKKRLENVKKIMVFSGKGGVGKSTVAANIAFALAFEKGFETGLMDVDIHGPNIPKILGIENQRLISENNKIRPVVINDYLKVVSIGFLLENQDTAVIWRGPLKVKLIRQFADDVNWGNIKYLVIDLPPGTGDEPLSVAQELQPVDGSIVVTTPQDLSLLDSRKAIDFSIKLGIPIIGVVENMSGLVCPHCGKRIDLFKKGGGEKAAKELGVPFLGRLPIEPEIVELSDIGIPFVQRLKDSEAYKAMIGIVDKIIEFLG
uniref:Iron-sulfur cluster carrier protein n=1 Tax=candidate division WOR-3 bacterium TaxID=2052148 RepID=A0A7C4Y5D5_UNCW3